MAFGKASIVEGQRSSQYALLRILALSGTILGSGLAAPAYAQSAQPSIFKNIDENGVDLSDGSFNYTLTEGVIGSGEGAILLERYFGSSGVTDNVTIRFSRAESSGTATITVISGNSRETFIGAATATTFNSAQGTGAVLTKFSAGEYQLRLSDGTSTQFVPPPGLQDAGNNGFCSSNNQFACGLIAQSTRRPNGALITYQWDVGENCSQTGIDRFGEPVYTCAQFWRQRGLSNNFGYRIRFSFEQESNPSSGLPTSSWHKRTKGTFFNDKTGGALASVNYAYPSSTITDVTAMDGGVWRFSTDANLYLQGIRRPGSTTNNIAISRNADGTVSQVVNDGVTSSYAWSTSGSIRTTTVTNAIAQQSVVTTDLTTGRPVSVRDPLNNVTSFGYDANSRLASVTRPEGDKTTYAYDARGNVTTIARIPKPGSGLANITTSAAFPASCTNNITCNRPTSTTDARGKVTDYSYDATHGGLLSVTSPADDNGIRPQIRYSYQQVAAVVSQPVTVLTGVSQCITSSSCAGTVGETKLTVGYDTVNVRPISLTRSSGDGSLSATALTSYDAVGNTLTFDGFLPGNSDTTRIRYDAGRRVIGVTSPDPDGAGGNTPLAQRITYRPDGQVSKVESGNVTDQSDPAWAAMGVSETTDYVYDANSRRTLNKLSAAATTYGLTQYSYDALGRAECTAIRINSATFASLPSSACVQTTSGAFGPDRIAKVYFDAAGRAVRQESGVGTPDVVNDAVITYTQNSQTATLTDSENNRTTYEYDGHDRLIKTQFPVATKGANSSSSADFQAFSYDNNGNLTSLRTRDGQMINYTYDNLGRITYKDVPNSVIHEYDISYRYDLLGRLTQALDSNSHFTSLTYDVLGRQTSESSNWTTRSSQYDPAGRRTRVTWGDGFYVTYDYDVTGNVTGIKENGVTSLATYSYDNLGRRTQLAYGNGMVQSYAYDPVSRLQTLTNDLLGTSYDLVANFTYNPSGQIVTLGKSNDSYSWTGHNNVNRPYTSNGLNQLTTAGATALGYDGRGNLTTSGTSTYTYTSENRLATAPGGYVMTYDPLGRYHWIANAGMIWMQYDGGNIIEERNDTGVLKRYVYGPGDDAPIVWYEGSGTADKRYLIADQRGSITGVTSNTGALLALNSYDEYGIPAATNIGRFGYTGQAWIPELGMNYYKARIYSPTLGRFMQTDPIGYADGMNMYAYVRNDPVNFIDPTGLSSCPKPRTYTNEEGKVVTEIVACADKGGGSGFGSIASLRGGSPGPVSGGGGPGRSTPPSLQSDEAKPSFSDCLIFAGKKNGVNLALDAGGAVLVLASAKFQVAAAIGGSVLGAVGIGVSIANQDATGAGLAFGGKQASNAGGIARAGSALARGATRFGAAAVAASTARDLAQAYDDYQQCRAGAGQ